MLFSDSIPEETLANPSTGSFVKIFDNLQVEKQLFMASSLRVYNPILCNDPKWLLRHLEDLGISGISSYIPIGCLQQLLLNAAKIFRLRGSSNGLELLIGTLTLGEVSVSSAGFGVGLCYLLPDSLIDGFITASSEDSDIRYLIDRNDLVGDKSISIHIKSKIFSEFQEGTAAYEDIIRCIKRLVDLFVGFHENCTISVTTESLSSYVYPDYLNDYFKNT